jgi:hypothetical protein
MMVIIIRRRTVRIMITIAGLFDAAESRRRLTCVLRVTVHQKQDNLMYSYHVKT